MFTVQNKESISYGSSVTLETIICYKCAIPFAVPASYKSMLQSTRESFYCPNGHSQAYIKSTESILKERLDAEKNKNASVVEDMQRRINTANNFLDKALKEKSAIKGQLTKIKNRFKNGVCPCCNRSFQNLANHISNQHPEFKKD